jgi:tetratricopeptide (TPR) repeat protein
MRKLAIIVIIFVAVLAAALPAVAQQEEEQSQPIILVPEAFNRGLDALEAQEFDRAVLDFSLVILLNPTFSPAYYSRAQSYAGMNDLDRALEDVNTALAMSATARPEYAAALYMLRAGIEQQQQQVDAAIDDYSEAIALVPTIESLASRAFMYMAKDDYLNALADFDDAIDLDDSNPILYVYRGFVNVALDDRPAAGDDYLHFFNLVETDTVDTLELKSGEVISIQVDLGVVHRIPFAAKAGQFMSALAAPSGEGIDPLMVLLDGQGAALTGDDDSGRNGSALIFDFMIPEDGEYMLVVGHSLGGSTGEIVVGLQLSDEASE